MHIHKKLTQAEQDEKDEKERIEQEVAEKFGRNFRVNGEMRGKNCVYDPILDEFCTKLSSKCKIRCCPNFKFWIEI